MIAGLSMNIAHACLSLNPPFVALAGRWPAFASIAIRGGNAMPSALIARIHA